jgi:hypothetical protein
MLTPVKSKQRISSSTHQPSPMDTDSSSPFTTLVTENLSTSNTKRSKRPRKNTNRRTKEQQQVEAAAHAARSYASIVLKNYTLMKVSSQQVQYAPLRSDINTVIRHLSPSASAETQRNIVISCASKLLSSAGFETCLVGSYGLRTYLPDSDINLVIRKNGCVDCSIPDRRSNNSSSSSRTISANTNDNSTAWYMRVNEALCMASAENHRNNGGRVRNVSFVPGQVKVVNCTLNNISVDVSEITPGPLLTMKLYDNLDRSIGRNHLFKRSVILIKGWLKHDALRVLTSVSVNHHQSRTKRSKRRGGRGGRGGRGLGVSIDKISGSVGADSMIGANNQEIMGARVGGMSPCALITLIATVFYKSLSPSDVNAEQQNQLQLHSSIHHPLDALVQFFRTYAEFDWSKYCVTLTGPKSLQPSPRSSSPSPSSSSPMNTTSTNETPFQNHASIEHTAYQISVATNMVKEALGPLESSSFGQSVLSSLLSSSVDNSNLPRRSCAIVDPLDPKNNLAKSLQQERFQLFVRALSCGQRLLADDLSRVAALSAAANRNTVKRNSGGSTGKTTSLFENCCRLYGRGDGWRPDLLVHPCQQWIPERRWSSQQNAAFSQASFDPMASNAVQLNDSAFCSLAQKYAENPRKIDRQQIQQVLVQQKLQEHIDHEEKQEQQDQQEQLEQLEKQEQERELHEATDSYTEPCSANHKGTGSSTPPQTPPHSTNSAGPVKTPATSKRQVHSPTQGIPRSATKSSSPKSRSASPLLSKLTEARNQAIVSTAQLPTFTKSITPATFVMPVTANNEKNGKIENEDLVLKKIRVQLKEESGTSLHLFWIFFVAIIICLTWFSQNDSQTVREDPAIDTIPTAPISAITSSSFSSSMPVKQDAKKRHSASSEKTLSSIWEARNSNAVNENENENDIALTTETKIQASEHIEVRENVGKVADIEKSSSNPFTTIQNTVVKNNMINEVHSTDFLETDTKSTNSMKVNNEIIASEISTHGASFTSNTKVTKEFIAAVIAKNRSCPYKWDQKREEKKAEEKRTVQNNGTNNNIVKDVSREDLLPVVNSHRSRQWTTVGSQSLLGAVVKSIEGQVLKYQWRRNGVDIPGAYSALYVISSVRLEDAGTYTCAVTNVGQLGNGKHVAIWEEVMLHVNSPPEVESEFRKFVVHAGSKFALAVPFVMANPAPTFQWRLNGVDIPGAIDQQYNIESVSADDVGTYTCELHNIAGTTIFEEYLITLHGGAGM